MTHDAARAALEPCPFCKATPHRGSGKLYHDQLHGEPHQDYSIWCPKGHAKVTRINCEQATEEWNTRASTSQGDAPVAWRYEIQRGPNGETAYAWVYDEKNEMVCTAKTYHAKQIVDAMGRPQPAPAFGVEVKPLVWDRTNSDGTIHIATAIPGEYWAWELAGYGYWSWGSLSGREVHGGLDGAKAAAQADYEKRIRSALRAPDAGERITPRWRTELDEIVGHLGAAIVQSCDKDDQIIMDHVKAAHEIAKVVRRQA